jgi:5-deoxy-glucuronate isomerase
LSLLVRGPVQMEYVGFVVVRAPVSLETGERELCAVVIDGAMDINQWTGLGRETPWAGPPDAVYLPPGSHLEATGEGELALCWAPAPNGGAAARRLSHGAVEVRGQGSQQRFVHPILMGDEDAESLLVVEVLTPGGHWSSYPPHKHDRDDPPRETLLEETYYHRVEPARGFGVQRVYTGDGSLDETMTVRDRDCVLVPRGYHTVSAPPGYELYYLNVMAGPKREWIFANDPDHDWTKSAS